jgi:F-type H+-transporting ATPase subunit gamma
MQITKAMELVSTAKLKKSKDKLNLTRPYYEKVLETVVDIVSTGDIEEHAYLTNREVKKSLYIVITGDRGLCGGYNINAIKMALENMNGKDKTVVIPIGKRAVEYFTQNGFDIQESFIGISESPNFVHARRIARIAMNLYMEEKIDEISLVYTTMKSAISQIPTFLRLVPFDVSGVENDKETDKENEGDKVTFEPSAEVVLDYLIPKSIESTIFGGLVESSASEQAARRIAMENATDNAEDMIAELTLSFNQARQSAITQEINEIVGGAEALK